MLTIYTGVNYYFNRTSIIKLIYLYSFLEEKSFQEVLSSKIEKCSFFSSENANLNSLLYETYEKFTKKSRTYEYPWGYAFIGNDSVIFTLKEDFDFNDFLSSFNLIKNEFCLGWSCIEFFDRNIKILEIFNKRNLMRDFRNEIQLKKPKKFVFNFKINPFFLENGINLSFIKNYDPKKIKLTVHFFTF